MAVIVKIQFEERIQLISFHLFLKCTGSLLIAQLFAQTSLEFLLDKGLHLYDFTLNFLGF